MTNASSQKRSREGGSGDDGVKRKRELSPNGASKDWRDVHLKGREYGRDREREKDRRRRDDGYHSSGRRDRDYRDRDRDADRRRRPSPNRHARGATPPAVTVNDDDDEKEEGEISPRPSPPPPPPPSARRRSPPRHASRHDKYRERSHSRDGTRDHCKDGRRARSLRSKSRSRKSARGSSTPPSKKELDEERDATRVQETLPFSPQKTEEEILAERRARRAAIKAKYESSQTFVGSGPATPTTTPLLPPPSTAGPSTGVAPSGVANDAMAKVSLLPDPMTPTASNTPPQRGSLSPPPPSAALEPEHQFELAKDGDEDVDRIDILANVAGPAGGDQQINAADYDPSLDRREDEKRRFGIENGKNGHILKANSPDVMDVDAEEEEYETEEDLDDMFAVALGGDEEKPKKKKKVASKPKIGKPQTGEFLQATNIVVDSAADPEGYYSIVLGERLDNGRYQVFSSLGKGMFANVIRARVVKDQFGKDILGDAESLREVAIKIIRCQESMYKAGLKEAQILQKLRALDPEDKKHLVKLERTFEHRGHLCLVFENLSMNLREVVKRFGKDVGLNIRAVRAYAHQLFLALSLLRKANVMHADIKPDNILVNEHKTLIKLCDLGSASDANENDITPYLVSRFYRAPEIILGVPYDPALDIWSIGCTLYELYTGKILFPGRSNNHMLRLMMELKGRFNGKMIKKAKFGETYFDELGTFESIEIDRLTGNDVSKKISIQKPTKDLRARLMPPSWVKMKDDESKMLLNFIDLLDKCLMLDPARRISPREALSHPFIRG